MAKKQKEIDIHAKRYIQSVFEDQLLATGFVCPDDKLLCWYRVQSEDILNSVIFYSPWAKVPLWMNIGYGITPLFEAPIRIQGVHFAERPIEDDRFVEQGIVEDYPINSMHYTYFSDEIWVNAPRHKGRGRYTLDEIIFPKMDQLQTIESVYAFHKHRRLNHPLAHLASPENKFGVLSKSFINMALWVDDQEIYPYGALRATEAVHLYQSLCNKHPRNLGYQQELAAWQQINTVFASNNRLGYLDVLSERRTSNIHLLKSKYGLHF